MNILDLRFVLNNPFDRWGCFINFGSIFVRLSKYKSWEIQHSFHSPELLVFRLEWSKNKSHAGVKVTLGIFGYAVDFQIYDNRHWDHYNDCWEVYEERSNNG